MRTRQWLRARNSPGLLASKYILLFLSFLGCSTSPPSSIQSEVTLTSDDRVLVLAPHPDDEVIGCGGVMQRATAMGIPLRVCILTYGDNNEWSFIVYRKRPVLSPSKVKQMGEIRRNESLAAARILGVSGDSLTFFGYPDFGTLKIWLAHWGERPAFRGTLTRVRAVPYGDAYRPGAAYKGEEIVRDLKATLESFRPTKIFVSHPADRNPDHRALYLFTRIAVWEMRGDSNPEIHPYLVHHKRWPRPRGYHPEKSLEPSGALKGSIHWRRFGMSPGAVQRKRMSLEAHKTQMEYSAQYLLSFVRANELFGDYPEIRLAPTPQSKAVLVEKAGDHVEMREGLSEEEREAFVGFEERRVRVQNDTLALTVILSRHLPKKTTADIHVFGYRSDIPFENMPKLNIKLRYRKHEVRDQATELAAASIDIEKDSRRIVLRIPLSLLHSPERILTSGRTRLGGVTLDWMPWRIVEISPGPHAAQGIGAAQ